jgi:hypothetical protein
MVNNQISYTAGTKIRIYNQQRACMKQNSILYTQTSNKELENQATDGGNREADHKSPWWSPASERLMYNESIGIIEEETGI